MKPTFKPKLFVGSSKERVAVARAIHAELRADAEVTVWDQGAFQLSKVTIENLLDLLPTSEFFVFVVAPDDIAQIRGAEYGIARDNVIFELGLAMGAHGRERVFLMVPEGKDIHLPTDLLGITYATYEDGRSDGRWQAAVAPGCEAIRQAILRVSTARRRPALPPIRAGISGSMSVGKKTLAAKLRESLTQRGLADQITTHDDVGRQMISAGRTADGKTEFGDYFAYFHRHLANMTPSPVGCVLHVRTVFDTLGYAEVNGNFEGEWMQMAREVARLCAEKFQIYFYIPVEPHVPLVDDGVRSTDPVYRKDIDQAIARVLREFVPRFVELRGTIDERVATAVREIENLSRR